MRVLPSQAHRFGWGLALVALVSLVVRLWNLGKASLWIDEAYALHVAQKPFLEGLLWHDNTPPLYTSMLHVWISFAGSSEVALRLPSVLAGTAAVVLVGVVVRRFAPDAGALLAAALVGLHRYNIEQSQTVRTYTLFFCLVAASWLLLLQLLERPSPKRRFAYGLLALAMLYAHVFGVFFLAAQAIYAAWIGRVPGARLAWPLQFMALLGFAAWLPILIERSRHLAGDFWIGRPDVSTIVSTAHILSGGYAGAILVALFGAFCIWLALRGRLVQAGDAPRIAGVVCLFAVPIFLPLAASLVVPIYTVKYIIPAMIGLWLAVAIVTFRSTSRPVGKLVAVILIAAIALPLAVPASFGPAYFGSTMDWRSSQAHLDQHVQPTDLVVAEWGFCGRGAEEPLLCPQSYYSTRTDLNVTAYIPGIYPCAKPYPEEWDPAPPANEVVWVILLGKCHVETFEDWLSASHPRVSTVDFGSMTLLRFEARE